MKNVRILLFAAVLLVAVFNAGIGFSESIFPILTPTATPEPTYETEPTVLIAPSYGAMANVAPDSVAENTQGGTIVTYNNVGADEFNRFGAYLGEKKFAVVGEETKDEQLAYVISDGSVQFVLIYDPNGSVLNLIYPQGMKYEECFFPGYVPLEYGKEIYVPNLGRFEFVDFYLNSEYCMAGMVEKYYGAWFYYDTNGNFISDKKSDINKIYTFLGIKFFNTTANDLAFWDGDNDILTTRLYYVHDEYGTFSYDQFTQGGYNPHTGVFTNGYSAKYDGSYYMSYPVESLTDGYKYVFFNLPEGVRTSGEGTIFVTIDFTTGEKYVMPLRVDGTDLFD